MSDPHRPRVVLPERESSEAGPPVPMMRGGLWVVAAIGLVAAIALIVLFELVGASGPH